MAKPSGHLSGHEARDWFLAAIAADGPVASCLDAVLAELDHRAGFITALKRNLSFEMLPVDTITDLMIKVRALDNTLRFRLPMLPVERPQAWFRASAATSSGPFQTTLLDEPVFAAYETAQVETVERVLAQAWTDRDLPVLPFTGPPECLWRTLLVYNARLDEIARLPAPFADLRLDVLPDGLPDELNSKSLAAFLMNVRTELLSVRDRLNLCHDQLRVASDRLWTQQRILKAAEGARHEPRGAADLRAEFRRRRSGATLRQPVLGPADLAAMQFMGFKEFPPAAALRQRYLIMARQLHPDLRGGDDQAFKVLSSAYARLSARMPSSPQSDADR